jgi:hypothetical protein
MWDGGDADSVDWGFLMMRRLWEGWKVVAERIGHFQGRVLLNVIYFVVVTPFALFVKISRDPLRERPASDTNWIEEKPRAQDLESSRKQY